MAFEIEVTEISPLTRLYSQCLVRKPRADLACAIVHTQETCTTKVDVTAVLVSLVGLASFFSHEMSSCH